MRQAAIVLAVLLAINAPAAAQPDPDPAGGAICLSRNAQRLDDRISDAKTIAAAAVAACRNGRFDAIKARRPDARDELIERALDGLRQRDIDDTTAVVLEWRRRSR